MFLSINATGYDYENNPSGEHKVRKKIRKKAEKLYNHSLINISLKPKLKLLNKALRKFLKRI